jgi:hypothetical protein
VRARVVKDAEVPHGDRRDEGGAAVRYRRTARREVEITAAERLAAAEAKIRQWLAAPGFLAPYRFVLESLEDGRCMLRVPFDLAFERPGGVVTGLAFMAAADAPCGSPS